MDMIGTSRHSRIRSDLVMFVTSTPFLTAAEIDELCAPLTQRHAQARHMCMLLGLDKLPRRPDGLPLVGRRLIEELLNTTGDYAAPSGFNWSR